MNISDIIYDNQKDTVQLFQTDSYLSIYKRTEKIVSAIYILTDKKDVSESNKDLIKDVRTVAMDTLSCVVHLLVLSRDRDTREVIRSASLLRSLLGILVAAHMLRPDLYEVLVRELDNLLYAVTLKDRGDEKLSDSELPPYVEQARKRKALSVRPSDTRTESQRENSGRSNSESALGTQSRKDAIMAILHDRKVVTIKDISESIKDYSEKTIQRDLIDLIKDNRVTKEGERRWSKYRPV